MGTDDVNDGDREAVPRRAAQVAWWSWGGWLGFGTIAAAATGGWSVDASDGLLVAFAVATGSLGFGVLALGASRARKAGRRSWLVAIVFAGAMAVWWALMAYDPGVGAWGPESGFTSTLAPALAIPMTWAILARRRLNRAGAATP